jgi:uncharacterized protein YlxW (UPF0749 family)
LNEEEAEGLDELKRIDQLEIRVTALERNVAVIETDVKHINMKLDKIDQNTTWLLRIVIGAVILAILGFFITTDKPSTNPNASIKNEEVIKHG